MRRVWVVLLALLVSGIVTAAQEGELLTNPGLEEGAFGQYTGRRGGEFPIYLPARWNAWLQSPTAEFFNREDRTTIQPHPGPGPDPVEGSRALNISCGFVTCTVAIYQQVSVQPGSNVQASARAQVKACNIPENSTTCGSAVESGAQTRIGIDPNGGTNPLDSDVVWSNWAQPHDRWDEMTVSATTTGSTATLFLYSTQGSPADLNRTYWDQTSLTGGGSGGSAGTGDSAATAIPTAPPSVGFVAPQNAREDGSIVHVVQAGDTIDSIAVAYGVTRQEILTLNNISDPRIIRVGQEIVIRAADTEPSPPAEATAPDDAPAPTDVAPADDEADTAPPTEAPADEAAPDATAVEVNAVDSAAPAPVVSVAEGRVLPANDPAALTSAVCALMFGDNNQNRIQEADEALLPGGTINLLQDGQTLASFETDGVADPKCFQELPPGQYVVSASAPDGYGLTSPDQYRLDVLAGLPLDVAFGAAEGVMPVAPPPADTGGIVTEVSEEPTENPTAFDQLIGVSGLLVFGLAGLVLIGGISLTVFLRQR